MATYINLVSKFDPKGIRQAQAQFAQLGKTIGISVAAIASATAIAGAGIIAFSRDSIKASSNLEESLNAVKVAYGSASEGIVRLGEDASSRLGVTQADFNQAAVRFSAFADRVVGSGGNVNGFINDLTTRAADFASVFNIDVSEALQVFQSGLSGEAEPLKRFGINLLDTEVKAYAVRTSMIKQGQAMTETQKVQARYGLLMESTNKTAGDFANTSDSLANSQRILKATFQDLQASVGTALAPTMASLNAELVKMMPSLEAALIPAAETLGTVFRTQVLPAVQEFTTWLASPEGKQAVEEFSKALADGVTALLDLTKNLIANWDAITRTATAIGIAVIAFQTLTTAAAVAQAAVVLFNGAIAMTPLGWAAAGIAAFAGLTIAAQGYRDAVETAIEVRKTSTETEVKAQRELDNLRVTQVQLQAQVENNVGYMKDYYQKELDKTKGKINELEVALNGANNELDRFNRLAPSGGSKAPASKGEDNRFRNIKNQLESVVSGGSGGGGGGTGGLAETTADRFKRVQAVIKKAQAAIAAAEANYAKTVYDINKAYNERVFELNRAAVQKQEALILESKARITDAFKSATAISLGDLFKSSTTRQLETQVRKLSERLTVSVTKETEKTAYSSVTEIINGLRERLTASKTLLANASKLTGLGFKQTFIEQIFATGAETGNALAQSILESSPETQAELRQLFGDMEDVSETGATGLANQIYDKFGLATRAMKEESLKIQKELGLALADEQKLLQKSLADAAMAFQTEIQGIKTQFLADLEQFDGKFAGLGNTIKAVIGNLNTLIRTASGDIQGALIDPNAGGQLAGATVTENVTLADLQNTSGIVIDEISDISGAIAYLEARIKAANAYIKLASSNAEQDAAAGALVANWTKDIANLRGMQASGTASGTVININVKTDSTQSQAMVGKTIGKIVTKYVTTGGQVLVSGS